MKVIKFVVATIIKFIWSIFRKEYSVKNMVETQLQKLAEINNCKIITKWIPMVGLEYTLQIRIYIGRNCYKYQLAVFNEHSYNKQSITKYVGNYISMLAKNLNLREV